LFPQSESVVAASFDLTVGERSGTLTVVAPAQALDSMFGAADRGASADAGVPGEPNLSRTMLDADVQMDVWMTGISMALGDLVQLREGYVIKFDHPTERQVSCTLNGETGFMGQVVSTGRKRALLIEQDLVHLSSVAG
jgi:flagellar motor switch protein FliM